MICVGICRFAKKNLRSMNFWKRSPPPAGQLLCRLPSSHLHPSHTFSNQLCRLKKPNIVRSGISRRALSGRFQNGVFFLLSKDWITIFILKRDYCWSYRFLKLEKYRFFKTFQPLHSLDESALTSRWTRFCRAKRAKLWPSIRTIRSAINPTTWIFWLVILF